MLSLPMLFSIFIKEPPLPMFQPLLNKAIIIMQNKHSKIFERIPQEQHFDFFVDAVDLPLVFYLKPSTKNPVLKAIKRTEIPMNSTIIRGKIKDLLNLLETNTDGDAMFFSQKLTIEGSTAHIVALRNALDAVTIDVLKDLSEIFSPYEKLFSKIAKYGKNCYLSLEDKLENLQSSLLEDVQIDLHKHTQRLNDTMEELDNIKNLIDTKKLASSSIRKKTDYNPIGDENGDNLSSGKP